MVFIPRWKRYRELKPSGPVEPDRNTSLGGSVISQYLFNDFFDSGLERDPVYISPNAYLTGTGVYCEDSGTYSDGLEYRTELPFSGAIEVIAQQSSNNNYAYVFRATPVGASTNSTYLQRVSSNIAVTINGTTVDLIPDILQRTHFLINLERGEIFINGVLFTTVSTIPTTKLVNQLNIGAKNNRGNGLKGTVFLTRIFNKQISSDEALELYNAPYQILKPRRKWYYFADTSAGNIDLLFSNINSNSETDVLILTQQHNVELLNANSNSNLDDTVLSQTHNTDVLNLVSNGTSDNINVSQEHSLNVNNSNSNSFVDNTNLSQTHNINISNILSDSQIDSIAIQLASTINLTFANIESIGSSDNITLTQTNTLNTSDANSDAFEDSINITQNQILSFLNLQSSSDISTIAIAQGSIIALGLANINSDTSLDNINIEQTLILNLSNIESVLDCDTINLLQNNVLILSDSNAQSIIDNIGLLGLGLGLIYRPEVIIKSSEKYKIIVLESKNI